MAESPQKRARIEAPKTGSPFAPVAKILHESKAKLDVKQLRPPGTDTYRILTGNERRTLPSLTSFERAASKGIRAQHLAAGGDTTAQCSDDITEPVMLSEKEQQGKVPVDILRPVDVVNGMVYERWPMSELEGLIPPVMQGFNPEALPL